MSNLKWFQLQHTYTAQHNNVRIRIVTGSILYPLISTHNCIRKQHPMVTTQRGSKPLSQMYLGSRTIFPTPPKWIPLHFQKTHNSTVRTWLIGYCTYFEKVSLSIVPQSLTYLCTFLLYFFEQLWHTVLCHFSVVCIAFVVFLISKSFWIKELLNEKTCKPQIPHQCFTCTQKWLT